MNPIKNNQSSVARTSGGYTANAMRAIRALQEQMKELGKRLQDEITSPSLSGTAQDELMRDLARQMSSIRTELEALQQSIIQHESVAALKKQQASERPAPQAAQQAIAVQPADASAPATKDPKEQSPSDSSRRAIRISTVGSVIDTKA